MHEYKYKCESEFEYFRLHVTLRKISGSTTLHCTEASFVTKLYGV